MKLRSRIDWERPVHVDPLTKRPISYKRCESLGKECIENLDQLSGSVKALFYFAKSTYFSEMAQLAIFRSYGEKIVRRYDNKAYNAALEGNMILDSYRSAQDQNILAELNFGLK